MFTKREHVKILAKNVVSRLEQDETIALNPRMRQNVYQDLFSKIESYILTDEDVRKRVLEKLGQNAEELKESDQAESDQYKAAKSVVMNQVADNAVAGLYYQIPLKTLAQMIGQFVMAHSYVEDVFLSDEEMEKSVVDFLKRFQPDQLH
jgi:hypothetical protein